MSKVPVGVHEATIVEAGFKEINDFIIWEANFAVKLEDGSDGYVKGSRFIVGKKGLSQKIIQSLRDALDWDGVTMTDIESPAINGTRAKITVKVQDDNPEYHEVEWINHINSTGGSGIVQQGSELAAKLGPLLRAAAGGQPAPRPRPAPPKASPPPPARPPAKSAGKVYTIDTAWQNFLAMCDQQAGTTFDRDQAGDEWYRIMDAEFNTDDPSTLSQEQINWLAENAANEIDQIPM